jgi:hypothetical protein
MPVDRSGCCNEKFNGVRWPCAKTCASTATHDIPGMDPLIYVFQPPVLRVSISKRALHHEGGDVLPYRFGLGLREADVQMTLRN